MKPHRGYHGRLRVCAILCTVAVVLLTSASTLSANTRQAQHVLAGPVYGGTLHVAYSSDMVSFDPTQAGGDDWFLMMGTIYNALYQYDRNGQPQLDLAAAPPTISPDRKTWTFSMRKGVLFHNGMEVTADDLAFSITRTLDPHLKPTVSWGQTSDDIFEGSHAFITGKATTVPGIQVLGRYKIRFVLTQPVAILPDILAESFNSVVPKAVVLKESPEYFASHPVGSGPFMLQSWQKGVQVVLVRNPHYFHTGKPYLDKIVANSNVSPNLMALRVQKGELEGLGVATEASASDLQQMERTPAYTKYLVAGPTTQIDYMQLDVRHAPLSNPALRQAAAMAINRMRLVRLLGGTTTTLPATQIYVPIDPQYDPQLDQHPTYPYDQQKAAALLKTSGYHGEPITLYFNDQHPFEAAMAPAIQQALQQVGINVSLRGVSTPTEGALAQAGKLPISIGAWIIDYPDAYDIYVPVMSCTSLSNHDCDPQADSLVKRSQSLPLGAARNALLQQAQARILQRAALVPLVFQRVLAIVSPRVGGYYYQPEFGWQFENYWLQK